MEKNKNKNTKNKTGTPVKKAPQYQYHNAPNRPPLPRTVPNTGNGVSPKNSAKNSGGSYGKNAQKARPAQNKGGAGTKTHQRANNANNNYNAQKRQELLRQKKIRQINARKYFLNSVKIAIGRIFVFLIMFVILFIISVAGLFINLYTGNSGSDEQYEVQIGGDDNIQSKQTVSGKAIFRYGIPYLNMSYVTEYFNFVITGDSEKIRYISGNAENDNVQFAFNSTLAVVNDARLRMEAPVLRENGDIYVPVSFFLKYAKGIVITLSEDDKKLTIVRETVKSEQKPLLGGGTSIDAASDVAYADITFTLRKVLQTDNIPEESLSAELLKLTDPTPPPADSEAEMNASGSPVVPALTFP